jgi:tetratricopeptide (TPR) repeat protein
VEFLRLRRLIKDIHHHPRKALSSIESQFRGFGVIQSQDRLEYQLARCYVRLALSQTNEAKEILHQCRELAQKLRSKMGEALTHVLAAKIAFSRGRYDRALEEYASAKVKAKGLTNSLFYALYYLGLAEIYLEVGSIAQSQAILEQASQLEEEKDTYPQLFLPYFTMQWAVLHQLSNQKPKALEALELALKQAYQSQNRLDEARIEICYGLMDEVTGSKEREQHILKGLAIFSQFRIPEGMAHSYLALGQVQLSKGLIREAENTVYKSFELTKQLGNLFLSSQAVKMLAQIKEKEGDQEGTVHFFKMHLEIINELRMNEAKQMIGAFEVQQKYEATQAEAEVFRLRNEALKRQSEDLLELYQTIRTINAFGQRITSSLDLGQLAQEIYLTLKTQLHCDTLGLAFYTPHSKSISFEVLLKKGKPMKTFTVSLDSTDSFSAWTVLHKQSLLLNNMPEDFGQYLSKEPTTRRFPDSRSAIFLPLLKGNSVKGIFTVQAKEINAYSRQHLNLLESLASFITIAVENSLQHSLVQELNEKISNEKTELEYANEKIAHLANHDQLTGLANRRLLGEIMNQQIRNAKRDNNQFAVFFVDLDGFKAINDKYGHEMGDQVLVDCAARIRSGLRESDFVARVGGGMSLLS